MDRDALPLLLADPSLATSEEKYGLDRLRLQKGVFLMQQRGPDAWAELYEYAPYDWGPFSFELARHVDLLIARGDLAKGEARGSRYREYVTTARGSERLNDLPDVERRFATAVRRFVCARSFTRLLRDVYSAYPDYAVNSRFSG